MRKLLLLECRISSIPLIPCSEHRFFMKGKIRNLSRQKDRREILSRKYGTEKVCYFFFFPLIRVCNLQTMFETIFVRSNVCGGHSRTNTQTLKEEGT